MHANYSDRPCCPYAYQVTMLTHQVFFSYLHTCWSMMASTYQEKKLIRDDDDVGDDA
jgi:hypothetical protein